LPELWKEIEVGRMNIAEIIIVIELLFVLMDIPTSNRSTLEAIRQELRNLNCKLDSLIRIMRSEE
jgi:hypothetical protein